MHYFHAYAVADRVNVSEYSDVVPKNVVIDPTTLLPSLSDLDAVKEELKTLIERYGI